MILRPTDKVRNRHYRIRLIAVFTVSIAGVAGGLPVLLGTFFTVNLLYTPCSQPPTGLELPAQAVKLRAPAGGAFRGYFVPGSNGATIIMPPAFTGGTIHRLPETEMLQRHGFAVFTFESRRCAGMGPVSLGYSEVSEVTDALNYLLTRDDVDPDRIGIYGFSSAGATAIMAAARQPQLKAVVAEGGYADFSRYALGSNTSSNPLTAPVLALYLGAGRSSYARLMGFSIEQLSPISEIGKISPRPILLVYGSREVSLPGAKAQAAAAGDNAEL